MRIWLFYLTPFNLAFAFYFLAALLGLAALVLANRAKWIVWAAYIAIAAGAVAHTYLIGERWAVGKHPPFSGLFDAVMFFAWSTVIVFAAAEAIFRTRWLALFVGATEVVFFLYASDLDRAIQPLMPVLKSMWLNVHVVAYMIAYSVMTLGFFTAVSYYIFLMTKGDTHTTQRLDRMTYRLVAFGFPLLTVGVITGAVWANQTWGRYWGWDPKETWSLITWIVYAVFLHLRLLSRSWSIPPLRRSSWLNWMAIVGFAAILFTFFMLQYLPSAESSQHIYLDGA